jgi:imidazolonepropionase-like amidohydrolase
VTLVGWIAALLLILGLRDPAAAIAAARDREQLPGTPPPPLALVGATLLNGTGATPLPDAAVLVRGGKIECAGRSQDCAVAAGVKTIDLTGQWITPGLVDAHVHFSQTGWVDGRPDAYDVRKLYPYEQVQARLRSHLEGTFRSYLCSGVTSVFDVGGYPWTLELIGKAEVDSLAPRVAAAGPLLSTLDFWLNLPGEKQFIYLKDEAAARAAVRYLVARGAQAVKVWFIAAPELDFESMSQAVLAAGAEAQRQGLPLIVHATGLKEAKVALRAGARLLVHSVWDQPVDEEFVALAREHATIYCPTLTVRQGYERFFRAVLTRTEPKLDDPNGCLDQEIRRRIAISASLDPATVAPVWKTRLEATDPSRGIAAGNLKRLHQAGVPIAMGTDAGNPLTLHGPAVYAEMEAMQAAGLTPMEVLVASTRGSARALGRQSELGTIEAGKLADLLILGADPTADIANLRQLRYVLRGGVLHSIGELKP